MITRLFLCTWFRYVINQEVVKKETGMAADCETPDVDADCDSVVSVVDTVDTSTHVVQLLDKLEVERKHVNTTGASVRPEYRWNKESQQQNLIGYIAERTIKVELKDLTKLGDLIEGSVTAGVNQIQPPTLDSSKRREVHRESLALAADDARANARTLAEALDAKLGKALEINAAEYSPQPAPMLRMQADASMAESAGQSYNAGEIRFDARVNVVFELVD
jgi:uncharacterized protein YggE